MSSNNTQNRDEEIPAWLIEVQAAQKQTDVSDQLVPSITEFVMDTDFREMFATIVATKLWDLIADDVITINKGHDGNEVIQSLVWSILNAFDS